MKPIENTKGFRLGKLRALEINSKIEQELDGEALYRYKYLLLRSLDEYSFKKRKADEPKHEGCHSWLEIIDAGIDFTKLLSPDQYGAIIKVTMDWRYNKDDAKKFYEGFVRNF